MEKLKWEDIEQYYDEFYDVIGSSLDEDVIGDKIDFTNFLLIKLLNVLETKGGKKGERISIMDKKVIELGKKNGVVTSGEVRGYYGGWIKLRMNKLVASGYFEQGEDCISYIKWKYIGK